MKFFQVILSGIISIIVARGFWLEDTYQGTVIFLLSMIVLTTIDVYREL